VIVRNQDSSFRNTVGCTAAVLFLTAMQVRGAVIRVSATATPPGDGQSWESAYPDLQTALSVAMAGDEIWVAVGTYMPGPAGDAVSSFVLLDSVSLYGGFVGDEPTRDERDPDANPTILSGDVGQDDQYSGGGGVNGWNFHTPNSGHVVVVGGVMDSRSWRAPRAPPACRRVIR
jgi:hypothetical protein